ncbi:MAG TPA: permease-like cell division protein FtsX [Pseudomonadales bacterium]|nr:permease-like cell division protein FtsX [Pseudomonadales bacterium]
MAKSNARNEKTTRGASATTISWRALLDAWIAHHRDSARDSLTRQRRAPLQHFLTAMVIGITLALPALFTIAIDNLQQLGERWDGAPRLSVFLQRTVTADEIQQLQHSLHQQASVNAVTLITPEQGLAAFEKNAGLSGTMELLEENPLPPLLLVEFKNGTSVDALHDVQTDWQQLPHVDKVQADMEWVQKLFRMMQLGERITIALAALLGLGALLSVGNTIRLAIENRRSEIVVAKLVGATDAFVRRPFLYSGFWFGLSGGIVAVLLVIAGYYSVISQVAELAALYHSDFALRGLNIATAASLLFVGIALGMLGAWLAVGQHLHDMRPR